MINKSEQSVLRQRNTLIAYKVILENIKHAYKDEYISVAFTSKAVDTLSPLDFPLPADIHTAYVSSSSP